MSAESQWRPPIREGWRPGDLFRKSPRHPNHPARVLYAMPEQPHICSTLFALQDKWSRNTHQFPWNFPGWFFLTHTKGFKGLASGPVHGVASRLVVSHRFPTSVFGWDRTFMQSPLCWWKSRSDFGWHETRVSSSRSAGVPWRWMGTGGSPLVDNGEWFVMTILLTNIQ